MCFSLMKRQTFPGNESMFDHDNDTTKLNGTHTHTA